jgi:hypothetical protein
VFDGVSKRLVMQAGQLYIIYRVLPSEQIPPGNVNKENCELFDARFVMLPCFSPNLCKVQI